MTASAFDDNATREQLSNAEQSVRKALNSASSDTSTTSPTTSALSGAQKTHSGQNVPSAQKKTPAKKTSARATAATKTATAAAKKAAAQRAAAKKAASRVDAIHNVEKVAVVKATTQKKSTMQAAARAIATKQAAARAVATKKSEAEREVALAAAAKKKAEQRRRAKEKAAERKAAERREAEQKAAERKLAQREAAEQKTAEDTLFDDELLGDSTLQDTAEPEQIAFADVTVEDHGPGNDSDSDADELPSDAEPETAESDQEQRADIGSDVDVEAEAEVDTAEPDNTGAPAELVESERDAANGDDTSSVSVPAIDERSPELGDERASEASDVDSFLVGSAAFRPTHFAPPTGEVAIEIRDLVKTYGSSAALRGVSLTIPAGSFYGIVGPNGAGKTTTLSIVGGLLRADSGTVRVTGFDLATESTQARRVMGVLPDRLRTFDRLTGRQLLFYHGMLRDLKPDVVATRINDLARAFELTGALGRAVSDYSAGMTKKIMLAGSLIHSPRVLILDEPFETLDPMSSEVILEILRRYVDHGGTVVLSSHGIDLVERVCSRIAVIGHGEVLAEGTVDEVRDGLSLEERFVELTSGGSDGEGLQWLHSFSG